MRKDGCSWGVIVFGASGTCDVLLDRIEELNLEVNIIEIWDNDPKKWGTLHRGIKVVKPHADCKGIDKILIASLYFNEIKNQLINELKYDANVIENHYYFDKIELIDKYKDYADEEINEIMSYVHNNPLELFNYDFKEEGEKLCEDIIEFDDDAGLYYTYENNKPMYFKKTFASRLRILYYYKTLIVEQMPRSPHCYHNFIDSKEHYDLLIDCGCAEGNFALDYIDQVEKVIIIETDPDWIDTYQYTFSKYKEKVVIVDKFVDDHDDDNTVSLDHLVRTGVINRGKSCLIKMDIEGAEEKALLGAGLLFDNMFDRINALICTYHHSDAYMRVGRILSEYGLKTTNSRGYMCFMPELEKETAYCQSGRIDVELRRALCVGQKS